MPGVPSLLCRCDNQTHLQTLPRVPRVRSRARAPRMGCYPPTHPVCSKDTEAGRGAGTWPRASKWEQGVTPLQPIPKRLLSPTYPAPRCVQSTALCNLHGGPRRGRRGYTCVTGEATHAQRGEPPAQGHTAHNSRAGIRTRACLAPSPSHSHPGQGCPLTLKFALPLALTLSVQPKPAGSPRPRLRHQTQGSPIPLPAPRLLTVGAGSGQSAPRPGASSSHESLPREGCPSSPVSGDVPSVPRQSRQGEGKNLNTAALPSAASHPCLTLAGRTRRGPNRV